MSFLGIQVIVLLPICLMPCKYILCLIFLSFLENDDRSGTGPGRSSWSTGLGTFRDPDRILEHRRRTVRLNSGLPRVSTSTTSDIVGYRGEDPSDLNRSIADTPQCTLCVPRVVLIVLCIYRTSYTTYIVYIVRMYVSYIVCMYTLWSCVIYVVYIVFDVLYIVCIVHMYIPYVVRIICCTCDVLSIVCISYVLSVYVQIAYCVFVYYTYRSLCVWRTIHIVHISHVVYVVCGTYRTVSISCICTYRVWYVSYLGTGHQTRRYSL